MLVSGLKFSVTCSCISKLTLCTYTQHAIYMAMIFNFHISCTSFDLIYSIVNLAMHSTLSYGTRINQAVLRNWITSVICMHACRLCLFSSLVPRKYVSKVQTLYNPFGTHIYAWYCLGYIFMPLDFKLIGKAQERSSTSTSSCCDMSSMSLCSKSCSIGAW